jgi:hypothetical protein
VNLFDNGKRVRLLPNEVVTAGFDTTLLAALLSALIAAVVSFGVVFFKVYVLDSAQKREEQKILRKQLLVSWIASINSNLQVLKEKQRHLEKLTVDDRPLDRLALTYPQLVETMTGIRGKMLSLNREIEIYDFVAPLQLKYLVMPDPRKGETYAPQQSESGEIETSMRMKDWSRDWLALIDGKRARLSSGLEQEESG